MSDLFDPFGEDLDKGPVPKSRAWIEKKKLDPYGDSSQKRKRVDLNPHQRKWFEENGWQYARVEKPNPYGGVTVDLWGFADFLACHPKHGIALFQVTSRSNASSHRRKIEAAPEYRKWLAAAGRVFLSLWDQPDGPRTKWRSEHQEMGASK